MLDRTAVHPRRPHQCGSWSGSVHAAHTNSRGASNTRVILISFALREPRQDRAARGVRERRERRAELVDCHGSGHLIG
jgi:hypothetical protein